MYVVSEDNYLEHYGVKGMRWGIIRTPEQLGHKIERKNRSYERSKRRYQNAAMTGQPVYSHTVSMAKKQAKLERFMKKNEELFNRSFDRLSDEAIRAGKKWLEFAGSAEQNKKILQLKELEVWMPRY